MLASVLNLELKEENNPLIFPPFKISINPKEIQLNFQPLPPLIGSFNYSELLLHPYLTYIGQLKDLWVGAPDVPFNNITESLNITIEQFLNAFWFIKDNSIFSRQFYLINLDANSVNVNSRNVWYSNSSGMYENTEFSIKEIERIMQLSPGISDNLLTSEPDSGIERPENIVFGKPIPSLGKFYPYNSFTRLQRAYQFLMSSRTTSLLPLKISSYMMIFECLFSNDSTEITHKICERVAFFIGGDKEQKKATYDLVKNAYGVRSKYVHGQQLDKKFSTREQLISLSKSIDDLLRKVFLKILESESANFKLNEAQTKAYFQDLIFS